MRVVTETAEPASVAPVDAAVRIAEACRSLETVDRADPDLLRILAGAVHAVIDVEHGADAAAIAPPARKRLLSGLRRARGIVASLATLTGSPLRHCGVCFDSVDQLVHLWALTPHQRHAVDPAEIEDARDMADLLAATLAMGAAINRYHGRRGGPPVAPTLH